LGSGVTLSALAIATASRREQPVSPAPPLLSSSSVVMPGVIVAAPAGAPNAPSSRSDAMAIAAGAFRDVGGQ
jgi:hypothetical protein